MSISVLIISIEVLIGSVLSLLSVHCCLYCCIISILSLTYFVLVFYRRAPFSFLALFIFVSPPFLPYLLLYHGCPFFILSYLTFLLHPRIYVDNLLKHHQENASTSMMINCKLMVCNPSSMYHFSVLLFPILNLMFIFILHCRFFITSDWNNNMQCCSVYMTNDCNNMQCCL